MALLFAAIPVLFSLPYIMHESAQTEPVDVYDNEHFICAAI